LPRGKKTRKLIEEGGSTTIWVTRLKKGGKGDEKRDRSGAIVIWGARGRRKPGVRGAALGGGEVDRVPGEWVKNREWGSTMQTLRKSGLLPGGDRNRRTKEEGKKEPGGERCGGGGIRGMIGRLEKRNGKQTGKQKKL